MRDGIHCAPCLERHGAPVYCAPGRCYCGHGECPASASYEPLPAIQTAIPARIPQPSGPSAWDTRDGATWLDNL